MSEICSKCGLPMELCVCESIAKEDQQIIITIVKRRFGKIITEVSGIDEKDINLKELAKQLKTKLACGGTIKDERIELQGSHAEKVKDFLVSQGFSRKSMIVKELRDKNL